MTRYTTLKVAMAALIATGAVAAATPMTYTIAMAAEQSPGKDDASEYGKLNGAKLSLGDAIAAAEKQFGGKAVNAALDNEQANASYEIELMTETGSQSVAVDGLTGMAKTVTDTGDQGEDVE